MASNPASREGQSARSTEDLIRRFRAGEIRALARTISLAETADPSVGALLAALDKDRRDTHVVGITGAPGAGKSTLVGALLDLLIKRGERSAVIAVDLNSPQSGGALLGDRIRMQRHASNPHVYIRSVGARGHLGGLSSGTLDAVELMAAFGFDRVIIETVGAGQSDVDVAMCADTTVVVLTPGFGDFIQTMKAGILEIADIFVMNKSDLEGAEQLAKELRIQHRSHSAAWEPPVISVVAIQGKGIGELVEALDRHRRIGKKKAAGRAGWRLRVASQVAQLASKAALAMLDEDDADRVDPREAALRIWRQLIR